MSNNRDEVRLGSGRVVMTDNPSKWMISVQLRYVDPHSQDFACTKLPSHWRANKSLPENFRIIALVDVPDGTEVSVTAGNEITPDAELRNEIAVFANCIAKFNDLRFIGKSGRGLCL